MTTRFNDLTKPVLDQSSGTFSRRDYHDRVVEIRGSAQSQAVLSDNHNSTYNLNSGCDSSLPIWADLLVCGLSGLALVEKYTDLTELNAKTLNGLRRHIEVNERKIDEAGNRSSSRRLSAILKEARSLVVIPEFLPLYLLLHYRICKVST